MMGPTVSTNGPLGEGGWTQNGCGGGFLFSPVCTTSSKPHLVVVKWPSGSLDVFDLEVVPGTTFMPQISSVTYAARPGTTSTLTPVTGDDVVWFINPGDLNDSGIANLYDPTQFVLTDAFGTQYLLDVDSGLIQTTDFVGNQTQFTANGIFPDVGTGVEFYRDGLGRIETMLLPDGSDITYLYDAEGDLTQTVDGEGQLMDFVYDDGHRLTSYSLDGQAPIATLTYDADGRLIGQEDATGVFVSTSSDPFSFEQVTVGPDPGLTTTDHYNAEGLMDSSVLSFVDDQG
ncbi:MAG: hypothetical protein GWP91_11385, partial [Rhodobacterales bacterium]|nr:hypothetical protein [Rhodobacterales bacterium]